MRHRLFDSTVINEMIINICITYKNDTFRYFADALATDLSLFINNSARRSISAQRGFHVLYFRVKRACIATYYITIFERDIAQYAFPGHIYKALFPYSGTLYFCRCDVPTLILIDI